MPLFSFQCAPCGFVTEELFLSRNSIPETIECERCSSTGARRLISTRIVISGAEDFQMDDYNKAHFSPAELRAGKGFKNYKELCSFEDSKKMRRVDPKSTEAKRLRDESLDEANTHVRVLKERGVSGLGDHLTKNEIQSKYNWSDSRYSKWKESSNAAAKSFSKSNVKHTGKSAGNSAGGA